MLDQALNNKRNILNYEQQIDYLQDRIDELKGIKGKADMVIKKKTDKRMRYIMGFYLL